MINSANPDQTARDSLICVNSVYYGHIRQKTTPLQKRSLIHSRNMSSVDVAFLYLTEVYYMCSEKQEKMTKPVLYTSS